MLKPSYADIKREFTEGSAIAPDVFDAAIEIVPDILIDDVTREVLGTPIADLLGYRYTRFTDQAKPNLLAAVFSQETGEAWQLKIFGEGNGKKSGQYLAPKGIGDKSYFSPIPDRIAKAIAQSHNLPAPGENETFWEWFKNHPEIPLTLTEGGKKALSIISLDQPAISLYGCQCGAKSKDEKGRDKPLFLLPELQPYVKGRRVNIAFDRDSKPSTIKKVEAGIYKLAIAIKKAGGRPYVATWDPTDGKGIDDIHARKGRDFVLEILDNAIPFDTWKIDWDKWQKFHTFTAKEKINQQYIDINPPKKGEILIINSPTNTGKSTLLKKWAKNDFAELGIIRIGNRNSLELQFCNESDFYHLQSEKELSDTLLSNPKKRVSFCFPSLIYTNSDHWENTVIYGDEIDGTIQQALFLNKDPDNLDRFKEALELCDRAVFLSGTLYDHHIEYLKALCPSKTLRIVGNTYQPQRPKIKLLTGTFKEENPDKINSRDKSPLLDRILSDSEPIMIQSDSKHFLNSLERLVKNSPNTDTLLVTSDTLITDKKVKAFIENPNGYIKEYADRNTRRLVVLASPTMTSGNDITIKYFKRDYHYYCGQLSALLITQKTIRIRDTDCERYISLPEFITSDDTEKCEYLEQFQNTLILAEINLLDEPENEYELIKKLTVSRESPHYKEACISKWIRDFERKNYRECVTRLLTMQGYEIELITDKKSESENTKKLKEVSNEIKDETSEAIYNASDKYIGKDERAIEPETKDDLMAAEKAKIIGQLPSIHYSESWSSELVRLIKFDKPRLIQQLNRRYLLHNPDTLKTLTAKRYHRHGQRVSDGKTTDIWRDKHSLVFLTAIERIGLKKFVEDAIANNTQFTNSDPAVTEIITKCQTKGISMALGRKPGKDPIKFLSWLLGTLGYELTAKRVRGGEARGERRYSIREACENPQFLSEIGEAIERRYDKITANCTTLEWAFLGENETPKNQTTETDSNPDIPVVLVGPDHPNPLIEEIDSSGPKVYYSEPLNTDDIFLATDFLPGADREGSLLNSFKQCLECVTRPKWSSFLAIIPISVRDKLLGLMAAEPEDSLLIELLAIAT